MLIYIYIILIVAILFISYYNFKISHNDFVFYNKTKFVLLLSSTLTFLLSLFILFSFDKNNLFYQFLTCYTFSYDLQNFHCLLGLDGISVLFFTLSSFLTFLCAIFNWSNYSFKNFGVSLLLINLILLILFSARDLLVLYLCFEALLIPMFFLIGVWGSREKKTRANYFFFFYTFIGSLSMLISIFYIYYNVGSFNFEILKSHDFSSLESIWLWLAFFIGFSSKIPMFPFHIWLPEAHVEAPTIGSVLLAGILLKLGVYGFLKVHLEIFFEATKFFSPLIYILCTLGTVFASCACINQIDMKRLIAYSSIAHMNLLTMGFFSNALEGLEGAILQCLSHAFVSSGLFFLIGFLYDRYHTKLYTHFSGLTIGNPIFSIMMNFYTFANIAFPGTSAFISEFVMLNGIFYTSPTCCFIAGTSIFFSAVYGLWINNKILFGNIKTIHTSHYNDLTHREIFILMWMLVFIIIIGVYSNTGLDFIDAACKKILF